jgi:hypothetical protein
MGLCGCKEKPLYSSTYTKINKKILLIKIYEKPKLEGEIKMVKEMKPSC